jgi:hypothetical protein
MSFDEIVELASRDERFMATVYAMNTLLIHKGIYTPTNSRLSSRSGCENTAAAPRQKLLPRPLWPLRSARNFLPGGMLAVRLLAAVIPISRRTQVQSQRGGGSFSSFFLEAPTDSSRYFVISTREHSR